jgi:hypothetical protein
MLMGLVTAMRHPPLAASTIRAATGIQLLATTGP